MFGLSHHPRRRQAQRLQNLPSCVLTWHLAYFAARLDPNGGFKENGSTTLELDESIDVFNAFFCWLYISKLKDPGSTPTTKRSDLYFTFELLNRIWGFTDFRGILSLSNSTIDIIHERLMAEGCLLNKHITSDKSMRTLCRTRSLGCYIKTCTRRPWTWSTSKKSGTSGRRWRSGPSWTLTAASAA